MIITIRMISGKVFDVEAEPSETVSVLKDKVVSTAPEGVSFSKDALLLVYKGKILDDAHTLEQEKIGSGSFCVAMQRTGCRKEPTDTSAAGQSSTTTTAPVQPSQAPAQAPPTIPPSDTAAVAEGSPAREDSYEAAASTLLRGTELEQNINQICDMGFERSDVVKAMAAAFNNPDRAVEYLMNGIPPIPEAPEQQSARPQAQPVAQQLATGTPQGVAAAPASNAGQEPNSQTLNMFGPQPPQGGESGGGGALDFLRTNAQFNLLRQIVAQNPQVLQPMLQELGRNNPELLRQINENQQEFLSLLAEEPRAQVAEAAEGLMQLSGQRGVAGGDPAFNTLALTEEEAEAIERLQSLGFDLDRCVEAFFICDKNEEIAANYLLEHADDT